MREGAVPLNAGSGRAWRWTSLILSGVLLGMFGAGLRMRSEARAWIDRAANRVVAKIDSSQVDLSGLVASVETLAGQTNSLRVQVDSMESLFRGHMKDRKP